MRVRTPVTATEAASHLFDLLDRVREHGESFVIVCDGKEVAEVWPAAPRRAVTLAELVDRLGTVRSGDPGFADDLERIQAEQGPAGPCRWTS